MTKPLTPLGDSSSLFKRSNTSLLGAQHNSQSKWKRQQTQGCLNIHELIPRGSHTFNYPSFFALFDRSKAVDWKVRVPPTLVITGQEKKFYHYSDGQLLCEAGAQAVASFFRWCLPQPQTSMHPLFIGKSPSGLKAFYSADDAKKAVRLAEDLVLQQFICSKGNRVSKIRVHWKRDGPLIGYLLANRTQLKPATKAVPAAEGNSLWVALREVNSTHNLDNSSLLKQVLLEPESADTRSESHATPVLQQDNIRESLIVNGGDSDSFSISKISNPTVLPRTMTEEVVKLLNQSSVNGQKLCVNQVVVDYLLDTQKEWHLIKIVQAHHSALFEKEKHLMKSWQKTEIRLQPKAIVGNKRLEELIGSVELSREKSYANKCNLRKMALQQRAQTNFEHRVGQRLHLLESSSVINQSAIKIRRWDSVAGYYTNKRIQTNGTVPLCLLGCQSNAESLTSQATPWKLPPNSATDTGNTIFLRDSLTKFDRVRSTARKLYVSRNYLVEKYGGERFVKNYSAMLMQKMFTTPALQEFTKDLNQAAMLHVATLHRRLLTRNLEVRTVRALLRRYPSYTKSHYEVYRGLVAQVLTSLQVTLDDQQLVLGELDLLVKCEQVIN